MLIEVVGVSTENKGAELMLIAIAQHLRGVKPNIELAVSQNFGRYEDRAKYQLRTKLPQSKKAKIGRSWLSSKLMPESFRRAYGLVDDSDVTAVIDASGFAFGDQHPAQRTIEFANNVKKWKQAGKPVVMLPQALGPFKTRQIRDAFREIVQNVDLVYARDEVSFAYTSELGYTNNLRKAPDFTNLVKGATTAPCDKDGKRKALIVPNHRMIEKTAASERDQYLPFIARCIKQLASRGFEPSLLLHDTNVDETLVAPLQTLLSSSIEVVRAPDPIALKGILGTAAIVVGSRFHALVSSLSQGVPCLAAGWSHKYEMLFQDYRCPDCIMKTDADETSIAKSINHITSDISFRQSLLEASRQQIDLAESMWREVDSTLGLC